MNLIALKEFRYAGRLVRPGDPFMATERDAKLLLLIGKVKAAQSDPQKRTYKRRDMAAE